MVLPEPVGDLTSTSPRSASGIVRDWTWNGVSIPRTDSADDVRAQAERGEAVVDME